MYQVITVFPVFWLLTDFVCVYDTFISYYNNDQIFEFEFEILNFLCFTPLSAIFQLYHWRPVLVVEEAGLPGDNHRPWASNW